MIRLSVSSACFVTLYCSISTNSKVHRIRSVQLGENSQVGHDGVTTANIRAKEHYWPLRSPWYVPYQL